MIRLFLLSIVFALRLAVGVMLLLGALFAVSLASVIGQFGGSAVLPADCAIVFGTAVRPVFDSLGNMISANPGPGIDRRVSTAAELYRQGLVQKLFVTGGTGEGMRQSEAMVMQRLAIDHGVDPIDIVVEGQSHSTIENLALTRPLAEECRSIVAVSDRYHLARIAFLSDEMQWEMGTIPAEKTAGWAFEARSVAREVLILSVLTLQYTLT